VKIVFETTPKMPAKNHFSEIIGINLEYALDVYDWEGWNPMTDNGITVSGFWDKSKDPQITQIDADYKKEEKNKDLKVYELDARGVYVKKSAD
jgi:hypothetical protein